MPLNLQVLGHHWASAALWQVKELKAESLDPRGAFLLTTPQHTYIWRVRGQCELSEYCPTSHQQSPNWGSSLHACMCISNMPWLKCSYAACCCALQPLSRDRVQGAQCGDQLAAAAEDAAGAIERFEGVAAPANGSVHVQQGAEPPDFAAVLQLPPSFQPEPCSAYDAEFVVSCCAAAELDD